MVRSVLVPTTMKLIGDWNWYLPPAIARLMRLSEPHAQGPAPAAPEPEPEPEPT